MQPPQDSGSSLQDSVVGGNLHTGNVIHNHYHITQNPGSPQQPQQVQQTVVQQPQAIQPAYSPVQPSVQNSVVGDDEMLIAYLIWFFLGIIGGHRFYFGYFGLGVLYLFTGGFFLIGWIVDLFLIGDLVRESKRKQMMQATGQIRYR